MSDFEFGKPVFPFFSPDNPAAQGVDHELHAVANAQHGNTEVEDFFIRPWAPLLIDTGRASGQDDALRLQGLDSCDIDVRGLNMAVDMVFPDTPGNQLIVLRAEINDQN